MLTLSCRPRLFILRLLLAVGLALGLARIAFAEETMAAAMANAIARMMESMGFANTGVGNAQNAISGLGQPGLASPMGMMGWPATLGTMPGISGSSEPMRSFLNRLIQEQSVADRNAPLEGSLDGVWEDSQDGLLIIQGHDYRIYSSGKGFIEGSLHLETDRIELTNPRENFTQSFEFALNQDRLVLRNQSGQVFLYRRLALGQGSRPFHQ